MSFQCYQREVNPQVGHEISGSKEEAQMMHLEQILLMQVFSSAVSQALAQHMQQTASYPPLAVAASTAAV